MNKLATWEAISKESLDALLLKQCHKAARAFQESICYECPDRNDEVCVHRPCRFAKRSVSRLIDILVQIQIEGN